METLILNILEQKSSLLKRLIKAQSVSFERLNDYGLGQFFNGVTLKSMGEMQEGIGAVNLTQNIKS